jgi:hypothetical protein
MLRWNRASVVTITPPSVFPVSGADMEAYLGLPSGQDASMIAAFIAAATDAAKEYTRRCIATETLEMTMDGFPGGGADDRLAALGPGTFEGTIASLLGGEEFDLAFPPAQSVTYIRAYHPDNTFTTVDSATYTLDAPSGRVFLNEGQSWPMNLRSRAAVIVRYVAGFTTVPPIIAQGIREHVAAMYECRGACDMPPQTRKIMDGWRRQDGWQW